MLVNFKLHTISRERALAMMCFLKRALKQVQGEQTEFTFYKVLIIILMALMFMADLCHIFIK